MNVRAQAEIGQQIKGHRRAHRMSLREISDLTGISVSTLSKIENNIVELSYTRMIAISEAIGINLTELVTGSQAHNDQPAVTARRSITKSGAGYLTDTKNYVYEYLNIDISKKRMIPNIATVKARSLAEYGELAVHRGEEFVLVLDGEVELHTEHYEPMRLLKGDSIYIDSTMPHAMISVSKDLARILFVCTHAIPDEGHVADEPVEKAPARPRPNKSARASSKPHRKNGR